MAVILMFFQHYWLYKLDIHNMNLEETLRLYANPLSASRNKKILSAYQKQDSEIDSLTGAMSTLTVETKPVETCECTRKCATKACKCKSALRKCTDKCHPSNQCCQNV